jgi:predicted PurR-regulated permease PerM
MEPEPLGVPEAAAELPRARPPRRRLSLLFILAIAAVVAYLVFLVVRPFSGPLLWAAILAVAFSPLYQAIHRRVRNNSRAALLTVLLIFVLVMVPLTLLGVTVADEARELYLRLESQSREEGGWQSYFSHLLERPLQWVAEKTGRGVPDLRALLIERIGAAASAGLDWSRSLFGNLLATLGNAALTLFVMFFLLEGGERFRETLLHYLPVERERIMELLNVISAAIVANLYGMLAVGTAQGMLVGIGFAIAGLPSPVMWGVIAAVASLIPFVGAALVWVPGVGVLAFSGSYGRAGFLLAWGLLAVGMADNLIRPLVLGRGLQLGTLTIFIALFGGVQAFGVLGLFAGPVVFSVAYAILRILHEEREEWERASAPAEPPSAAP